LNCVFSFNTPWHEPYRFSTETVRKYCQQHGIEYRLFTEPKVNWNHYYCERFHLVELLKEYDRVLYLDADIVATPTAENIFDVVPPEAFGAFNENRLYHAMDRDPMVEALLHLCPQWPKIDGRYRFFNAGVMLASKNHVTAFEGFRSPPDEPALWLHWPEQTYLNYLTVCAGLPFHDIGRKFNCMSMGLKSSREVRFQADFIHYAGSSEFYDGDKYEIMQEDIRMLWG